MPSLNHWLHSRWQCVSKKECHYITELDNEYYEYGVYVVRG